MSDPRPQLSRRMALFAPGALALGVAAGASAAVAAQASTKISYRRQAVGEVDVFYREAGPVDVPVILLLHGFPTSSHMFRDLIPHLAQKYRVIAPDLPGFGQTKAPPRGRFAYTFDNLAKTIDGFIQALGLTRYALYVFDYGAPTGFRLAAAHPERVTAIITQNGNAYLEGLSDGWTPLKAYWANPSPANREALRAMLTPEMTRTQYVAGSDETLVSPDGYMLDIAYLARPGQDEIQLDLFADYRANVALYPAWQAYFRQHRPPILAAWGRNDIFFLPPGAEAFKRDQPEAEVRFFEAGHFALETHSAEIGALIVDFLGRKATA
ncbi:alpha/beta fold hydrolase [Caulobacter sp. X]|uniref:alpha/beta fold hydrolase n=1 Tax=Caulobacter sp. X TaxID=2048901 RepID=UPI000C15E527|nr:alpha/beta hydrolase [Caulobacter sp. X]PIC00997.1 alpha/beta hydrolase [Caulobacter sp. X]